MNAFMIGPNIALVGDHKPEVTAHQGIQASLEKLQTEFPGLRWTWVGTQTIHDAPTQLAAFDAVWCIPASPYLNFAGGLSAIQFARESARPFLGTCGGFQHAVIEFARNVMGLSEADHAESNPDAQ